MTDLRIATTSGTDTALDEATVQEFKASVRGQLIRPGDAGYDDARKIFNAMIDRHPASSCVRARRRVRCGPLRPRLRPCCWRSGAVGTARGLPCAKVG